MRFIRIEPSVPTVVVSVSVDVEVKVSVDVVVVVGSSVDESVWTCQYVLSVMRCASKSTNAFTHHSSNVGLDVVAANTADSLNQALSSETTRIAKWTYTADSSGRRVLDVNSARQSLFV